MPIVRRLNKECGDVVILAGNEDRRVGRRGDVRGDRGGHFPVHQVTAGSSLAGATDVP